MAPSIHIKRFQNSTKQKNHPGKSFNIIFGTNEIRLF